MSAHTPTALWEALPVGLLLDISLASYSVERVTTTLGGSSWFACLISALAVRLGRLQKQLQSASQSSLHVKYFEFVNNLCSLSSVEVKPCFKLHVMYHQAISVLAWLACSLSRKDGLQCHLLWSHKLEEEWACGEHLDQNNKWNNPSVLLIHYIT